MGYADAFAGGTFVHYQLPVHAYHRYHLPVAGTPWLTPESGAPAELLE